MTLADRVRNEIAAIFDRLAEDVGATIELDEDNTAAAPFQMFAAEQALLEAWDKFVEDANDEPI